MTSEINPLSRDYSGKIKMWIWHSGGVCVHMLGHVRLFVNVDLALWGVCVHMLSHVRLFVNVDLVLWGGVCVYMLGRV